MPTRFIWLRSGMIILLLVVQIALLCMGHDTVSAQTSANDPSQVPSAAVRADLDQSPGFPPLPTGCGGMGTPSNYERDVCCVNGYVYINGRPVTAANVTIAANGQAIQTQTAVQSSEDLPYFTAPLNFDPLAVQPGDPTTLTVSALGYTQITTFAANVGDQQVDVVLPYFSLTGAWRQTNLSGRFHAGATAMEEGILLFGGENIRGNSLADTWSWDGVHWNNVTSALSPSGRRGHSMAYDPIRQEVLLFGGHDDTGYLHDMWRWYDAGWERIPLDDVPSARAYHQMVYDRKREQILLFGGLNDAGVLADTWAWNGAAWHQLTPAVAPPPRSHHQMVYDQTQQQVLLFGGNQSSDLYGPKHGDFWRWDGETWSEQAPPALPTPRSEHSMVYEVTTGHTLLFGGLDEESARLADTWVWNGVEWTLQAFSYAMALPIGRSGHLMTYDRGQKQVVLVGGFSDRVPLYPDLADTWIWQNNEWVEVYAPGQATIVTNSAMAAERGGSYLLFGGELPLNTRPQNNTYRWQAGQWSDLGIDTTLSPRARYGHQLVRNEDGSQQLLFGGINADDEFLWDTWLWDGTTWSAVSTPTTPPSRAFHAMTFDAKRQVWFLFGGEADDGSDLRNDLWAFDGSQWVQQVTDIAPSPRRRATLTYDPGCACAWLFGGQGDAEGNPQALDDLWMWDGATWQEVYANLRPTARYGHGAVYDSTHKLLLISGGRISTTTTLSSTWAWNGNLWLEVVTTPALAPMQNVMMDSSPDGGAILALGEHPRGNRLGEGTYTFQNGAIAIDPDGLPVATIKRINPRDARHGSDIVFFEGAGNDADASNQIAAYQWTASHVDAGQVYTRSLGTESTFSITASLLPVAHMTVTLAVQDDEGNWSLPVFGELLVRSDLGDLPPTGLTPATPWTLLIYAVGFDEPGNWLDETPANTALLERLRSAEPLLGVNLALLYRDAASDALTLYTLSDTGHLTQQPLSDILGRSSPEIQMESTETLRDFIHWGMAHFASDYYALALIGHGHGLVGLRRTAGADSTDPLLTPIELRTALQQGTEGGARRLDVLHFDSPSFGLLEDITIGEGLANYAVASAGMSWGLYPYEEYLQRAQDGANPKSLAQAMAQAYAAAARSYALPYTVAVYDLVAVDEVAAALDGWGKSLVTYLNGDPSRSLPELAEIRSQAQKYDSNYDLSLDDNDSFVDLADLLRHVSSGITETAVVSATAHLSNTLAALVVHQVDWHGTGTFVVNGQKHTHDLQDATGIGIFYPLFSSTTTDPVYMRYTNHELFAVTRGWGWTAFLERLYVCAAELGLCESSNETPTFGLYLPILVQP